MTVNAMRHLDVFRPNLYEDKRIHIVGKNVVAKQIAYLIAKLGVDTICFHDFSEPDGKLEAIAAFTDEMARIKPTIYHHESPMIFTDVFDGVVIVAEDMGLRPDIYRNILEMSMDVEVVLDIRIDQKSGFPVIHTLKSEDLYMYDVLYEDQNLMWEIAVRNPLTTMQLAVWTVNQFITWTQQTFQMEGKEDRVVQPVQTIQPPMSRVKAPQVHTPFDERFYTLKQRQVSVIGVGATGSSLVALLVACGFDNITVYDFDEIESHNIANQWYRQDQIGLPKVVALHANIQSYYGREITACNERVSSDQSMGAIVFLLTDSMKSRKEIGKNLIERNPDVDILIETRMGAELFQVYATDLSQEGAYAEWQKTLFDEGTVQPELSACGTSITVGTTAMLCATYAVNQLFHIEAVRQEEKYIEMHSVFGDMYPPYAIIK